jgi:hypothetical protein
MSTIKRPLGEVTTQHCRPCTRIATTTTTTTRAQLTIRMHYQRSGGGDSRRPHGGVFFVLRPLPHCLKVVYVLCAHVILPSPLAGVWQLSDGEQRS